MDEIKNWADEAFREIIKKLERTSAEIGANFPHAAKDGKYDNAHIDWWTNGFWPGIMWLAYRSTKDERFLNIAVECENKLDRAIDEYYGLYHDVGFMWTLSSVAQYKLLGTEQSKKRALHAANLLAGRYNPAGRFIRAWNGSSNVGWAIVDCLMNLCILHWASNTIGDPRYRHIAVAHAETALDAFVRDDGSVNHIVVFDPETGEKLRVLGGQGHDPGSAWSRGTAWAVYGFALSYMYTKDERFLNAAKRVANFFIASLPEDSVPHWDFRVSRTPDTPRDTSAGACAASGMLQIAKLVPECEAEIYFDAAVRILKSLRENYSTFGDDSHQEFLRAGTGNLPENSNINVGLIYGDYFYMEAIDKLRGNWELFW